MNQIDPKNWAEISKQIYSVNTEQFLYIIKLECQLFNKNERIDKLLNAGFWQRLKWLFTGVKL